MQSFGIGGDLILFLSYVSGCLMNIHGTPQARRRLQISWEWNLGSLEEQPGLLTAEPSLFLNVTVSCAVCAVCCLLTVDSAIPQREVSEVLTPPDL